MRVICFACHGWHMPPCDCQPGPGGTGDGVMPRWWIDSPGDPGPLFIQAVDASSTLPCSPMDVPPSRRVGFEGGSRVSSVQAEICPTIVGEHFFCLWCSRLTFGGVSIWENEDRGDICSHRSDLASGMLG